MHRAADLLHTIRPRLIAGASQALATGEGLQHTVESEVVRFFDAVGKVLAGDGPDALDGLLAEWVQSRPADLPGDTSTALLPALLALRTEVLRGARADLPAEDALDFILAADSVFSHAAQKLVRLEVEARLAQAEARLADARLHLERLDKSKSDFISVAAHELKTPLTLIEGYANILAGEFPPDVHPRAQVILAGMANGTRRLKEIVEDMVDVSMIDNNLLSLNFQPVWINRLLDLARAELEKVLRERSLMLRLEPFEGWDRLTHADPERLYQVFMNVLRNAVKYTPDHGTITVGGRQLPGFFEVTVADTGIGIAAEDQARIFEKFGGVGDASLHSSGKTKFKGGGPGLGLPIAKGIIEAHGGTIWCESPGHDDKACPGATFHIMIPQRDEPPQVNTPKLFGLTPEEVEQIAQLNL